MPFNIPYMLFMAEAEGLLDKEEDKKTAPAPFTIDTRYTPKEDDGDHSFDQYNYYR